MKENITGMMVYYYFVCKRKLWYFCHEINMEAENENVLLGKLLDENSYRFGFIRRYPPDKTEITGVSNEPWHYRYVGIEAATEMYNQGVCLEEYLKPEK